MLEYLFGTTVIEKILFYLLLNQKCYSSQLKSVFTIPLCSFQRALAKLESGGVLISYKEGKTVMYEFNPRYVFLPELKIFLQKAYKFLPEEVGGRYYELALLLFQLASAIMPEDMNTPGNYFHRLHGELNGYFSVKVNGNWRLIFQFQGEDAILVDYIDYH